MASEALREWMGRNGLASAPRKAELVYSCCQAHRDAVAETSDYAIAREAGVSVPRAKENVNRWCSENGVPRTRKEAPKERKDDVYAWLDAHPGEVPTASPARIAREVGCARSTACRWLKRYRSEMDGAGR